MYEYKATCTAVYDADTITVDIDCGFQIWKKGEKIRLFGINAPEVRGKERPAGLEARDYLRDLLLNKNLLIQTIQDKKGKYGRYLAHIFLEGMAESVNVHLVVKGYAVFAEY